MGSITSKNFLSESGDTKNYRDFLETRFSRLLYLTIGEDRGYLDVEKIESAFLRVFSRGNKSINADDKRLIERLLQDEEIISRTSKKLSEDDIKGLGKNSPSWNYNHPNYTPKKGEYGYDDYLKTILKDFIRLVLDDLKYRQINTEVETVIGKIKGILTGELILSGNKYEVVRIGENYYIYDKVEKYIIPKTFRLTDTSDSEIDPEISMDENRDELFITTTGDILVEIKFKNGKSSILSLKDGKRKTPNFERLDWIKEIEGKVIVSFYTEGGTIVKKYFCIETQQYIKINEDFDGDLEE